MNIESLGFTSDMEKYKEESGLSSFDIGRVVLEHKDRYVINNASSEYEAELIGNLRFNAESRYDLPAVGDWVAFTEYDTGKALIHAIYPRKSIIERKAVGKSFNKQIIATNIDVGIIVQAVDRDFNLNRLERYLTICYTSKVKPLLILTKTDLIDAEKIINIKEKINQRIEVIRIITTGFDNEGYKYLQNEIIKGKTYCFLGSSGVGKSTLINLLSGKDHMKTGEISTSVNKGKHITTHRELLVLDSGGIVIDNPGMREIGLSDTKAGLEITFEGILAYANRCKFKDCQHIQETGCAVLEALHNEEIDEEAYSNFRKMLKENLHFESNAIEKKKKQKNLGKLIKNIQKQRKKNKF